MRLLTLVLPAAAVLLPACDALRHTRYIDSPPFPKPSEEVLTSVLEVLERQEFRVKAITEGKKIEAVRVSLSPMDKAGKRWTAMVLLEPAEAPASGIVVKLMVEVETNSNITTPMDEKSAEWGGSGWDLFSTKDFDPEMEELLLSLIGMKVMPPKLAPGTGPARGRGR